MRVLGWGVLVVFCWGVLVVLPWGVLIFVGVLGWGV